MEVRWYFIECMKALNMVMHVPRITVLVHKDLRGMRTIAWEKLSYYFDKIFVLLLAQCFCFQSSKEYLVTFLLGIQKMESGKSRNMSVTHTEIKKRESLKSSHSRLGVIGTVLDDTQNYKNIVWYNHCLKNTYNLRRGVK